MRNLQTLTWPCKRALRLRIISSQSWHMLWSCTRATSVFFSHGKFFYCCHHLVHRFVGEWAACVPHEVFSKFLAAFKELYDHFIAFEFCCFGIIFTAGKEVRPLFARSCRWYSWSPHFLGLSGCLCSRLTSGLHMWTVRSTAASLSFTSSSCIFCPGTGIYVLASCVLPVVTFPRSWVLSWHEKNRKTKMVVEAHRSISLFFVWFLTKGDSCSGFSVMISSCHR